MAAVVKLRRHQRALGASKSLFEGKDSPSVILGHFIMGSVPNTPGISTAKL